MNNLKTIQQFFKVFKYLTKVAQVLCIIGAVGCGIGAMCALALHFNVESLIIFGEPLDIFPDGVDLIQKFVELLAAMLTTISTAVLLGLSYRYIKTELADGTPFTLNGAEQLKQLGICYIWLPIVAVVVSQFVAALIGLSYNKIDNLFSVFTGIVMILASLIFRYGAELVNNTAKNACENNTTDPCCDSTTD